MPNTTTLTAPPLAPFPERNTSPDDSPLPRYTLLAPAQPPQPQPQPPQPSQPHLSGLTDEICPPWLLRIIQRDASLRSALATAYKEDRRRQSGE